PTGSLSSCWETSLSTASRRVVRHVCFNNQKRRLILNRTACSRPCCFTPVLNPRCGTCHEENVWKGTLANMLCHSTDSTCFSIQNSCAHYQNQCAFTDCGFADDNLLASRYLYITVDADIVVLPAAILKIGNLYSKLHPLQKNNRFLIRSPHTESRIEPVDTGRRSGSANRKGLWHKGQMSRSLGLTAVHSANYLSIDDLKPFIRKHAPELVDDGLQRRWQRCVIRLIRGVDHIDDQFDVF